MTNRLYVDIKTDCNGNLTGPVKFPADGVFVFEALLTVIEEFAKSVGKPVPEVIADMYGFSLAQHKPKLITERDALAMQNQQMREAIDSAKDEVWLCCSHQRARRLCDALTFPDLSTGQIIAQHDAKILRKVLVAIQPEDSYQDDWFKAKADNYAKALELIEDLEKTK